MSTKAYFKKGAPVGWKWLGGVVEGRVNSIFFEPTEMIIKGKKIKRNGSQQEPAYLVQSNAGNFALKLHRELFPLALARKKPRLSPKNLTD